MLCYVYVMLCNVIGATKEDYNYNYKCRSDLLSACAFGGLYTHHHLLFGPYKSHSPSSILFRSSFLPLFFSFKYRFSTVDTAGAFWKRNLFSSEKYIRYSGGLSPDFVTTFFKWGQKKGQIRPVTNAC